MSKELKLSLQTADVLDISLRTTGNLPPYFAFTSPPNSGYLRALVPITYCRETLCEYMRQQLRAVKEMDINFNKLHLIIYRRVAAGRVDSNLAIFQDQVLAGQLMVNLIEKHYGWPLTKVVPTTIINKDVPNACKAYYLSGSKRWIKSPIMLSLFTLLFRIAARGEKKFKLSAEMKSMKTMFSALDDVADKSSYQELSYYRVHGARWKVVLDNYNKLFSKRSMLDHYYPGHRSWYFNEGINKLCDESSLDPTLNKQFIQLAAKSGV